MPGLLTRQEINCFALYLSRNTWTVADIANLFDMSEQNVTERIYNAMELEGKIELKNPIPCVLRNGTRLNYELDAEFALGEAYTKLYYGNQTNIEEVAKYIRTMKDDDIPVEIILHPNENTNSLWRKKIYRYAKDMESNRLQYERNCANLRNIINRGIDGFDVYNADDDRRCGIDFVQERICSGFKEVMEAYRMISMDDDIVPDYYHDMNALAWSIHLHKINIKDNPINFSNIDVLRTRVAYYDKYPDDKNSRKGCDYENWQGYQFLFSSGLTNNILKLPPKSDNPLIARFNKEITNQGYDLYDIYRTFKKISGFGTQSLALLIWYRVEFPVLAHIIKERRERLIRIRDNEGPKLLSMNFEEANNYLEEGYGKEAHLWET